jgi:hypothetical protein
MSEVGIAIAPNLLSLPSCREVPEYMISGAFITIQGYSKQTRAGPL